MKKMNKKSILLLIATAALLIATIGGTVAYLVAATQSVVNTFTPAHAEVEVTDTVENGTKKDVVITNKSDIPVYMRVAVIANWCDANGKIVGLWNDYAGLNVKSNWTFDGGYYYYNGTVAADAEVTLFTSYKPANGPAGAHLEMDVVAQVIQAEGMGATSAQDAFKKAAESVADKE